MIRETALTTEKSTFPPSYRQPIKDVNRQVISRNAAPERLWANSREPIRQPLLRKLAGNAELSHKACLAFTDILFSGVCTNALLGEHFGLLPSFSVGVNHVIAVYK